MLCKFPSEQMATSVSRVFSSAQIATFSSLSVKSNSAWQLTIASERTELNVAITTPSKNFERILLLRYRLRNKKLSEMCWTLLGILSETPQIMGGRSRNVTFDTLSILFDELM